MIEALARFKVTCAEFEVPNENIRIIATEATRNAINSAEYRDRISNATGWTVELLAKEDEGRIGAMGIASSFSTLEGLVLDLGGGSVQITWIMSADGQIQICPQGSVSLPYGAAALMQRLKEIKTKNLLDGEKELSQEISHAFDNALSTLAIPSLLTKAKSEGGLTLYLSGGGFRGWGYILMSQHEVQPYPIPIINGFSIPVSSFHPSTVLSSHQIASTSPTSSDSEGKPPSTFRISSRRASQVPAISLLITSLLSTLPPVKEIHFAQGGVREGILFSSLPHEIQTQDPLIAATLPYAPPSAKKLAQLISTAIPDRDTTNATVPAFLADQNLIQALANLLFLHGSAPKDIRPSAALRCTTTGALASAHGLSHHSRAVLALALFHRWGGELAPCDAEFYRNLVRLVGGGGYGWWAGYIGRVAAAVGELYPAGRVVEGEEKVRWEVGAVDLDGEDEGRELRKVLGKKERKKGGFWVVLTWYGEEYEGEWEVELEKWGKRKRWVDGRGAKVKVIRGGELG